ncbi:MAG: hypothetical protein B5M48_04195 [Candidatus Omnitrophica bacterium 4484_213]|nr:MAG: hypothetical protein B5M48_04195 [Candidatus Omnitrophica bacterium 4484_213]
MLLPAIKHPIHILAKVVRVEEIEFKKGYNVGVNFLELHLTYGLPPILRIYKKFKPIEGIEPLTKEVLKKMIYSIMNEEQIKIFEGRKEMNFAFSLNPKFRFRVNVHYQRGVVEAAFRSIPSKIGSLQELRLSSIIEDFTNLKSGIVIIGGTTGSGKTTTLSQW